LATQELLKSIPYEDELFKFNDKVNLFIKPDGTPILVDRITGEIPSVWKDYDVDSNAVQKLKDKLSVAEK